MTQQPIVLERVMPAPIEQVWKAITDPAIMKQWYFDIPEFKAEAGANFSFVGTDNHGVDWVHLCRVLEVTPPHKLSHSWRYEGQPGDSIVTWELFEEGDQTRVRLSHAGLETFPPLASLARENFEAGWNDILGNMLPRFLSGQQYK